MPHNPPPSPTFSSIWYTCLNVVKTKTKKCEQSPVQLICFSYKCLRTSILHSRWCDLKIEKKFFKSTRLVNIVLVVQYHWRPILTHLKKNVRTRLWQGCFRHNQFVFLDTCTSIEINKLADVNVYSSWKKKKDINYQHLMFI